VRAAVVALVVVVFARGVAAQPSGEASTGFIDKDVLRLEVDDCTPDQNVTKDELLKRGLEYYNRGEVLYLQGDYKGAVSELVRSYCQVPFYSLLKDIGQAYERELEYGKAIAYFERYVLAVPTDAQKRDQCSPDPQEDKKNVYARIHVLEKLPAKIRVQATPADAAVSIVQSNTIRARGTSGDELIVPGGPYNLVVEHDGYKTATREIHADIGKPYTYFEQLEPRLGRLKFRSIPGDARLFLDKRQVGTGVFDSQMPGGRYTISAEAPDHMTYSKVVEVLPDKETSITLQLQAEPEFGRKQLLLYGTIGGALSAGLLANVTSDNPGVAGLSALGGIGAGFLAVYYGTPKNLALGTSSLTVTSSLVGGVSGGAVAAMLDRGDNVSYPLVGGGLLLGAIGGYYLADRTRPSPGDSAVINSGALWGTVAGGLFTLSFEPGPQISAGLVLSGLGMGTLGGVLLQRYFTVSRGRAALIDASGVVGMVLGLAGENLVEQASGTASKSGERTANYALGGLAAGLILGGLLTRSIDDPKLAVTPTINKTTAAANGTSGTTIGIAGAF
jgi:tetratricopeptide (TPR) repeat protein